MPTNSEIPQNADAAVAVNGFQLAFPALGTLVELTAFADDEAKVQTAFDAVQRDVRQLESILTDYDSESETRRLTTVATKQAAKVSDPLWEVLAASDRWYQHSDGAFDSSLGSVTVLWRSRRRDKQVPSESEISAALQKSGWQYVSLDENARTVRLTREGLRFDFGAIGKGYIVDQAYRLLVEHDLPCCLVNISGNMRMGSPPPEREGWRVAIASLEKNGEPLRKITCANTAIATSGDLWQYVIIDGVKRSHILDPSTGIGVRGPVAATVIADNATDADALATAACVLREEDALALARKTRSQLLIARKSADDVGDVGATDDDGDQVKVIETDGFPRQ
ncbi:MAG: FAD:protein FMN transferase [Pirellulaceae bacterium]